MLTTRQQQEIIEMLERFWRMRYYAHYDSNIDDSYAEYSEFVCDREKYRFLDKINQMFLASRKIEIVK